MARARQLAAWIEHRGGVAHTTDARAHGFTVHDERTAVATGTLRRVRRSWLVGPTAHPSVVVAVEVGGRLTCVSEASRRGLWVPDHTDLHVALTPSSSSPRRDGIRFHRSRGPMPVARRAAWEPFMNVLAHVAACLPRESALAVWESAIERRLVALDHLVLVSWRGTRARELAALAGALSGSGLETIVVTRLRPFGLALRQQVRVEGHDVDLLVGDRLILQLDGFRHHSAAQDRRRDIAHDARLVLRGYTVLRFDYAQILFGWDDVERTILTAVAQGRHRARHPASR